MQGEQKIRFKMYKKGKHWLVAGLISGAIGLGAAQHSVVSASENPVVQDGSKVEQDQPKQDQVKQDQTKQATTEVKAQMPSSIDEQKDPSSLAAEPKSQQATAGISDSVNAATPASDNQTLPKKTENQIVPTPTKESVPQINAIATGSESAKPQDEKVSTPTVSKNETIPQGVANSDISLKAAANTTPNPNIDWNNWQKTSSVPVTWGEFGTTETHISIDGAGFKEHVAGDTQSESRISGLNFYLQDYNGEKTYSLAELGMTSLDQVKNFVVTYPDGSKHAITSGGYWFEDQSGSKTTDINNAYAIHVGLKQDGSDFIYTNGIGSGSDNFGWRINNGGAQFKIDIDWAASKIPASKKNIVSIFSYTIDPKLVKAYFKDNVTGKDLASGW